MLGCIGFAFLMAAATLSAQVDRGLIAYYSFDSDAADISGNGNAGSIHNATPAPGLVGGALRFNGADSYVEVPSAPSLAPQDAVTVTAWAKVYRYPTWHSTLVYKAGEQPTNAGFQDRQYTLWLTASGGVHFTSTPEGAREQVRCDSPGGLYPLNEFVHVAGVLDAVGGTMTIYVNGRSVQECAYPRSKIRGGNYPLRLGGPFYTLADQSALDGVLDEVRIYNRALNGAEISALFTQTGSSAGIGRRDTWVYSADTSTSWNSTPAEVLKDFIIILERSKKAETEEKYQYRVTVLADTESNRLAQITGAALITLCSQGADLFRSSLKVERYVNASGRDVLRRIIDGGPNADEGWQDLAVERAYVDYGTKWFAIYRDVIGFVPNIGTAFSIIDAVGDALDLFQGSDEITPSDDFARKLHRTDGWIRKNPPAYYVEHMEASNLKARLSTDVVVGARFTLLVDESGVDSDDGHEPPLFFLKARNWDVLEQRETLVGLEIGRERRVLVNPGRDVRMKFAIP